MCTNITFDESKRRMIVRKNYYIAKMLMFESTHDMYFGIHTSAGNTQHYGQ